MSRSDQKDRMTMEEKFFVKSFSFSYSGLNKLLFSPRLWYKHYVLQEREERTDIHLIEGKVIHALLLDQENFDKNFMVLPGSIPTGNTRIVLDKVFRESTELHEKPKLPMLVEYRPLILKVLQEINLHQSLKTDDQRISKIVTDETEAYWDFLKKKEGKDILDQETLTRCKEGAAILKANPKIADLLKLNNTNKKIQVYNEIPIERPLDGFPFGLKGIIDNLVIDDIAKMVYINDIKTTGKTIAEFQETVEYYNYWLQACVYMWLIRDMVPAGYIIKFTFIVIDKYQQVYPFEVSPETGHLWNERGKEVLETAKWHYENRKFNLPIKFEKETVIL